MTGRRGASLLLTGCLVLMSCGNRLPPQRVVLGSDGPASGTHQSGEDAIITTRVVPGREGTAGTTRAIPGKTFGDPSCRGVATGAPGVTATSVKVGTIVARSGPLPGQFFQMTQAVAAYFGMVNDAGGVCGRRLELVVQDDGLNADKHLQAAKSLVEDAKVFAIVGMLTAADKASAGYLCDRGVPDVGGFALSYNRSRGTGCPPGKPPVYWSPLGSLHPSLIGDGQYYELIKRHHLERGAVLYHSNLDISKDQGLAQQSALNHAYCRLQPSKDKSTCDVVASSQDQTFAPDSQTYDVNPVQPESAFDPVVQQMIRNGVDSVFTSMEINSNIKLLRAINRNRSLWRREIGRDPIVYFQLSAYDPKLLREAERLALGAYVLIPHVPFTESGHPEMARYLAALRRYAPSAEPSSFGAQGWAGARLFVDALVAAGAALTRDTLRRALDLFSAYTAGGLVGPLTPRERVIFNCWVLLRVEERSGALDFYRTFPSSGFFCNNLEPWR